MTIKTITVKDRNEAKFLVARGFVPTPSPRSTRWLDFEFDASEELFSARTAYVLNAPVPVLDFIKGGECVDRLIVEHRRRSGEGGGSL